jgi:hypothetical protein
MRERERERERVDSTSAIEKNQESNREGEDRRGTREIIFAGININHLQCRETYLCSAIIRYIIKGNTLPAASSVSAFLAIVRRSSLSARVSAFLVER